MAEAGIGVSEKQHSSAQESPATMEAEADQRPKPHEDEKREKGSSTSLESIIYGNGELKILNQLMIPLKQEYESIQTVEEGWAAIRLMKVRVSQRFRTPPCLEVLLIPV